MKKVLYLGWLGHQNVGDELMWELFRDKFQTHVDLRKYKLIQTQRNFKYKKQMLRTYDMIVLGGGSLITPGCINILYKAIQAKNNIEIMI